MVIARHVFLSFTFPDSVDNPCRSFQWAKLVPHKAGYNNNGWPGCCRPPNPEEYKFIGAADWPSVSAIHRIPIPSDIKALLDSISAPAPTTRGNASPPFPSGSLRGNPTQSPTTPSVVRRSSVASSNRFDTLTSRTAPVAISGRIRPGGSPQQLPSSLTSNGIRDEDADAISSSLPEKSTLDQLFAPRRSGAVDARVDKRDVSHEPSRMSPSRKYVELGGSLSRRGSESRTNGSVTRRPSISAAIPSMQISKVTIDAQPRRHTTPTNKPSPPTSTLSKSPSPPSSKSGERPAQITPMKRSLEHQMAAVSLSSASSDSSGSNSESTVISDGGFTDYLSDESEAELQRQAELKAAQAAQNLMEEQEFKVARQQLQTIDLRPPKSWTQTGNVPSSRSQAPVPHNQTYGHNTYSRQYGITSASRG